MHREDDGGKYGRPVPPFRPRFPQDRLRHQVYEEGAQDVQDEVDQVVAEDVGAGERPGEREARVGQGPVTTHVRVEAAHPGVDEGARYVTQAVQVDVLDQLVVVVEME